ncbi:MAG TPA: TolC family protein [Vicinamibacterales bacterium]|nr:TolC family protein [Vicinamibacterales bacterium]
MTIGIRKFVKLISAIALTVAAPGAAAAQTAAAREVRVTIDEAIQRSIERAPRLAEAHAREAAAKSTYDGRRSTAMPSGSISTSLSRNNHVDEVLIPLPTGGTRVLFPDIPDNYRVRGELFVPIYAFGRVGATLSAARSDIDAAVADAKTSEADVRLDVSRAYWTLAAAIEAVSVMEQSLARTDAYVTDVGARVDAGVLPPNDVLTAKAQRARQSVRLVQARNDRALAELDLGRLIGEPAGTRIVLASAVDRVTPSAAAVASQADAALVARAIGGRSEALALAARSAGLRSASQAAMANLRPYVTGVAAVEPARPNMRFVPPTDTWRTSWTLGVNVTWPLFDSGKSKAESAALAAHADAVDARHREFDDLVSLEIRQRLLDLESGRAALAASAEAVTAAAEARRVVEERFRAGVATNTEVLDAQVALLEAALEQTRLNASLRLTEARLVRAVGNQ